MRVNDLVSCIFSFHGIISANPEIASLKCTFRIPKCTDTIKVQVKKNTVLLVIATERAEKASFYLYPVFKIDRGISGQRSVALRAKIEDLFSIQNSTRNILLED